MLEPRFNLPISWAAWARWLNKSTNLRSRSSILIRQSEMSMNSRWSLASVLEHRLRLERSAIVFGQRRTTNDQRSHKLCHTLRFFARIAFDDLNDGAAHHRSFGKFSHRFEL